MDQDRQKIGLDQNSTAKDHELQREKLKMEKHKVDTQYKIAKENRAAKPKPAAKKK